MITCKEDLINTYIENDQGELRDLYLAKCEDFGLYINPSCYLTGSAIIFSKKCEKPFGNTDHSSPDLQYLIDNYGDMKQITLSDLKPRTKTVYDRVEFNHAWELVKQFELHNDIFYKSSSTPTYELMSIENVQNMLRNKYPVSLYRKVEKEIDWRDEVYNKFQSSGYHWSTQIGEVINDESDCFLDLCRVALRATGELE